MEIVKAINLKKIYGKDDALVKAVNDVNISIDKGEFVAIVGNSGSGKSTLLHLLGGLDKPTSGTVEINGCEISLLSNNKLAKFRRKNIGFIFQSYNLIPVLTAEENITLPLRLDKKHINKDYINRIIDFLGLSNRKSHYPNALSGGQQQRVAIARALANKPSIILADEPTGNLDSKSTEEVMSLLKECKKEFNQTLIMITHNENIASTADRKLTIHDGRIV